MWSLLRWIIRAGSVAVLAAIRKLRRRCKTNVAITKISTITRVCEPAEMSPLMSLSIIVSALFGNASAVWTVEICRADPAIGIGLDYIADKVFPAASEFSASGKCARGRPCRRIRQDNRWRIFLSRICTVRPYTGCRGVYPLVRPVDEIRSITEIIVCLPDAFKILDIVALLSNIG